MKSYFRALSFLTIIPYPFGHVNLDGNDLALSAAAFPLAGATIGLVLAGAAHLLLIVFPPLPAIITLLAISFFITRGFHLDGLADTADGLIGTFDRDKAFKAMKDSSVGVMGSVVIILTILMKIFFLAEINPVLLPLVFLFLPLAGRWSIVYGGAWFKPAREGGLGNLFLSNLNRIILLKASLGALVVIALVSWLIPVILFPVAVGSAVALFTAHVISFYAAKRLGGLTGDILGALSELGELFFLVGFFIVFNLTGI